MDTRGLVDKYQVKRNDGRALKGGGAIVLEVGDPKVWPAIAKLADSVEAAGNDVFASELRAMLDSVGAIRTLDRYRGGQPLMAGENPAQISCRLLLEGWEELCAAVQAPELNIVLEQVKDLQAQVLAGTLTVDQLDCMLTKAALCRIEELRGLGWAADVAEKEALAGALVSQRVIIAGLAP